MEKARDILLDILFPQLCIACRTYLATTRERELLLCTPCFSGIRIYNTVFQPNPRLTLLAATSYENAATREIIHRFKYSGFTKAAQAINEIITAYLETISARPFIGENAIIVPIPLHKSRLRKRGFNQAGSIAQVAGTTLNLPVVEGALVKTRRTKSQAELRDSAERRRNVRGSFALAPGAEEAVRGKRILLVDDVYTSGATMDEAARALRRAGAKEVLGLVAAKAGK